MALPLKLGTYADARGESLDLDIVLQRVRISLSSLAFLISGASLFTARGS